MDAEKEFKDLFLAKCGKLNGYQIWSNTMTAIACSISNAFDIDRDRIDRRKKEENHCVEQIGDPEFIGTILGIITYALEENPDQDFLGKMFMSLELSSDMTGQFFTPYHVARMLAEVGIDQAKADIDQNGWAAINDGACGAGATLIGAVNALKERGINYQDKVCFIANDLDRVTALMCYIQLSLLGCAGYVVVADSLSCPIIRKTLFPEEQKDQEFWYTPMWSDPIWICRRSFNMNSLIKEFDYE